ncbi:hypothetical protein H6F90_18550 [Trichocoleus sp. FACHB-591]|uniref:hypothetical protein n=1 Tax=Trichocoleus sp. FACHB-591 TaxID=2692872 RepID=UPI0016838EC3|nr:hypothetical protein [Trichocoleus sp. FACHB-591]MBD2097103.1 hypothetical protein [Trichocoleus sp. FACHB-591]
MSGDDIYITFHFASARARTWDRLLDLAIAKEQLNLPPKAEVLAQQVPLFMSYTQIWRVPLFTEAKSRGTK